MPKTDEGICPMTEISIEWCDHCKTAKEGVVTDLLDDRPVIDDPVIAKHDGFCPACGEKIMAELDHIGKVESPGELHGRWVHYGCGR